MLSSVALVGGMHAVVTAGGNCRLEGCVVRDAVRVALRFTTAQFSVSNEVSPDAPSIDERVLRSKYGPLDAWPADAQLGLCLLAWTLGSGFSLRGFRDALRPVLPDFEGASRAIPVGSDPTQIALNGIARRCFENGSVVVRWDLNPEILYWPMGLAGLMGTTYR